MSGVRQEDMEMKIPALLHLSRLGYGYLARTQLLKRERKTNILPDVLLSAAERINGVRIAGEAFDRLMENLQEQLDAEDLGRQFYRTIRSGRNGLRLIDFEHPENNLFQSATELACGSGAGSFRPDITLFINGIPLAMIEVKTRDRARGLQAEYDRMQERLHHKEMRRYLQCAQIWAFSDNHTEDLSRLQPMEGSAFATVVTEDFPVYTERGKHCAIYHRLLPRDPEEEQRILEDNGIRERPRTRIFQRNLSPGKQTHRMMTTLFSPDRFLFLLRYGIQYVQETDPEGKRTLTRRMLTNRQTTALRTLTGKAKRGYRNWTAPPCGAAGEAAANASLIALLHDLLPGARLYWISADEATLLQDLEALQSCGVSCAQREKAKDAELILIPADADPGAWLREKEKTGSAGRSVFVLPQANPQYGQKTTFSAKLRRTIPDAILVTRSTNRIPENAFSAILLCMEAE